MEATDKCCGLSEFRKRKFYASLLAEFLGTMILVVGACGSAIAPSISCDYRTQTCVGSSTIQISLGFAFSVATGVWVTAHVSGGHINPAVTFGFWVARRISLIKALLYIVFQCAGALAGAAILKYTAPDPLDDGSLGTSQLAPGVSQRFGFGIELVITFILVITVFASVDAERKDLGDASVPFTIGIVLGMCHLWAVSRWTVYEGSSIFICQHVQRDRRDLE